MALIPTPDFVKIGQNFAVSSPKDQPTRTYKIEWERGRVQGYTDGQEAMMQAVRKILQTDRFAYLIYSWSYGMEWNKVIGKDLPIVRARMLPLLKEALLSDSRIRELTNFKLTAGSKRTVIVSVTVGTIFGPVSQEVTMNV